MAVLKQTIVEGDLLVGETIKLYNSIEITSPRVNFFSNKSTINVGEYAQSINLLGQTQSSTKLNVVSNYNAHGVMLSFNSLETNATNGTILGQINFKSRLSSTNYSIGTKASIYTKYIDSNNNLFGLSLFDSTTNTLTDQILIGEKIQGYTYLTINNKTRIEKDLLFPSTTSYHGGYHTLQIGNKKLIQGQGSYQISNTLNRVSANNPYLQSPVPFNWDITNKLHGSIYTSVQLEDTPGDPRIYYHFVSSDLITNYESGAKVPIPTHWRASNTLKIPGSLYILGGSYVPTSYTTSDAQLIIYQNSNSYKSGILFHKPPLMYNVQGIFFNSDTTLAFTEVDSFTSSYPSSATLKGYISNSVSAALINFTGNHRVLKDTQQAWDQDNLGKIVVSCGTYCNFDSTNSVSINESLPIIKMSNSRNQKNVFGVISSENEEDVRTHSIGAFVSVYSKPFLEEGRVVVNSIGEGAVWVCNINGNLENGDYVTTCEIPGHGMKQDEDILMNYTVAKITCDCDFSLDNYDYICEEFEWEGTMYRRAFVGCTYHCG